MKREKDIKTCVYDIYSSIRRSIRETLSAREMSSAKWRIRSSLFLNKNVFRSLFAFEMAVETVRLPSRKLCLRQNGRKERKSGSFLESTVRLRDDSLVGKKDGVSPLEKWITRQTREESLQRSADARRMARQFHKNSAGGYFASSKGSKFTERNLARDEIGLRARRNRGVICLWQDEIAFIFTQDARRKWQKQRNVSNRVYGKIYSTLEERKEFGRVRRTLETFARKLSAHRHRGCSVVLVINPPD